MALRLNLRVFGHQPNREKKVSVGNPVDRPLSTRSGHTRRLSYNTRKYGLVDEIQCIFGPLTTAMPQLHHIYQPP